MPVRRPLHWKQVSVILLDAAVVLAGYLLACLFRFEFSLDPDTVALVVRTAPYVLAAYMACFAAFSLYRGIYYFSSFSDLFNIAKGVAAGGVLAAAAILFVRQGRCPRSVLLLHPILTFLGVGMVRFGIRLAKTTLNLPRAFAGEHKSVLLIGAGNLGESLLRHILKTPELRYRVIGLIDDDSAKWGMRLHGHTVLGGRDALPRVLDRYQVDEIIVTVASRRGEIVRTVVEALRTRPVKPEVKVAPSLEEMLLSPRAGISLRRVRPADLLNRTEIRLDTERIAAAFQGKTVLVSGAGGTIGSELCRQVLSFSPGKVVLVESHATSLFYVDAELRQDPRGHQIIPVLGDVRDQALVDRVFQEHKPHIVLHAAAHKHVLQLEYNVHEALANNILGTYYLASASRKHGAEVFLLVSTDKAVRAASVMGATKRVAELAVQSLARQGGPTRFAAVRFGNVLGSSGSVFRIFSEQIERGEPVTVTHPEARRYFMTVEEAVQLILQAASMARGGEVFILKMGTPVRILDLAKNLIILSGLEPGKDIEIRITGLKQGEKLDEELMEDQGECDGSTHPSIMVLKGGQETLEDVESRIIDLEILIRTAGTETLVRQLRELAPTFTPAAAHETEAAARSAAG